MVILEDFPWARLCVKNWHALFHFILIVAIVKNFL